MVIQRTNRTFRPIRAAVLFSALAVVCGSAFAANAWGQPTAKASTSSTLKIITWVNPPAVTALTKIDAEFHAKYPNINVQLQTATGVVTAYATLLQTTVDANSADIVTSGGNAVEVQPLPLNPTKANMSPLQYWATTGVFLPLNGQPFLKDYTNTALQVGTYKGQVVSLLSGVYQRVVFYNKADFAKYHISVPHTYDQFMAVLKTLSADGITPLWLALGGGATVYADDFLTMPLMQSLWLPKAPGQNISQALQTGTASWNNPYFVHAMTEEASIAKYIEPDYTGISWEGMPGAFAENKAAMLLDGSWDLATVQAANPKLQVGSFPLPGSNVASDNQPMLQPDLNFDVLKNAPNKAAALQWLAFFSSKPIYEQYCDITGISPVEKTGTYTSFSAGALGSLFGKGINVAAVFPPLAVTEGYWDTPVQFPLLQVAVMAGTTTPQAAAKEIQADWKK
jgi:raffinose/stachyose/melibiose transport system substrate-binding protein